MNPNTDVFDKQVENAKLGLKRDLENFSDKDLYLLVLDMLDAEIGKETPKYGRRYYNLRYRRSLILYDEMNEAILREATARWLNNMSQRGED